MPPCRHCQTQVRAGRPGSHRQLELGVRLFQNSMISEQNKTLPQTGRKREEGVSSHSASCFHGRFVLGNLIKLHTCDLYDFLYEYYTLF